jgi:SsrA-binding protein
MTSFAKNKRATFDHEIIERYEAGIKLSGPEVKSIRNGRVNLKGSFVKIMNGTPFAYNIHISPYQSGNQPDYEPTDKRKLLLKKKEISYLVGAGEQAGHTILPLEIYTKKGLIKMKIGLCKSRKKYDKRELLKKRSQEKEMTTFYAQ